MKTTDTSNPRGVLADLERLGVAPNSVDVWLRPDVDRDGFVATARLLGVSEVSRGEHFLWALRRDGITKVWLHAGEWWNQVEPNSREKTYRDVRTEILSVLLDDVAVPA